VCAHSRPNVSLFVPEDSNSDNLRDKNLQTLVTRDYHGFLQEHAATLLRNISTQDYYQSIGAVRKNCAKKYVYIQSSLYTPGQLHIQYIHATTCLGNQETKSRRNVMPGNPDEGITLTNSGRCRLERRGWLPSCQICLGEADHRFHSHAQRHHSRLALLQPH
jgi:hypothetical protein